MLQLITNADIYTPHSFGIGHLLVCAGKVVWLGDALPEVSDALIEGRHDAHGRRLIPGLIDPHVHLTGGGGESGPASRVPPLGLSRFTLAGITTAVGVLGTDDTTRSTGELVATVRGLIDEGLSAWCHTGGYHLPPATLTGSVRDDIVYVDRILGVGELALSDHRSSQPTLDELLRIASDAHVAGLMTDKAGIVHLHLGDGERGLELVRRALDTSEIPPRVFNPTHVNRRRTLFDEAMALADRGCVIDVTAFPVEEGEDAWTAEAALERYLDSDLPAERITVSSDGGGCLPTFDPQGRVARFEVGRPGAVVATLRTLLQRGRPLAQVLPAFTSNVADHLRLAGKGRIEAGADADLVVLGKDGAVRDVMAGGKWHVRERQAQLVGAFEASPS